MSDNSLSEMNFAHERDYNNFYVNNATYSTSFLTSSLLSPSSGNAVPPSIANGGIGGGGATSTTMLTSQSSLSWKTFSKLKKLVWLDLSGNRINHISTNYLPKSLVTLDLSRNMFHAIPFSFLQHLHDLKILSLKDNLIGNVDTTTIDVPGGGVPMFKLHLEKLDLSLNQIVELPSNLFNNTIQSKAISFERNYISHIPANSFVNLAIVHMVMAFNRIDTIDANAFRGLEMKLEYLDLERNFLNHIPMAINRLQKLRYLYLTSNHISDIHFRVHRDDTSEEVIDVIDGDENGVDEIDGNDIVGDAISMPGTLRVLSLAGNNFTVIPLHSLNGCTELSYLNIGYNKISEIQENGFHEWGSRLQTLLLRNNKITHLNYGSFNGLDSIKEISLSFNDIHFIHPMVFENISRTLKILELSFGIYQEEFPTDQLKCLTELIWLGLDNNNLKIIPDDSLTTMKELSYINLSFNRIIVLPRNIFMAELHRNLMDVDLSYNMISIVLSYTFDSLTSLQFINLAHNRIRNLNAHSFTNLPYLAYIDLTFNNLLTIGESAFSFLPALLRLDLMFNNMHALSLNVFKHVSNDTMPLRLNISHNRLTHFDGDMESPLYIYSIDATHNELVDTQSFRFLGHSLRVLFLKENNISNLSNHAFGDLELLESLDVSYNRISLLRRRSFQGLVALQKLDLSHNHIDQLQIEQFSNVRNLRILNLSHNRLKALPREVFVNTRIEYLNVEHNFLTRWPSVAISDIGFTLRSIHVGHNHLEHLDATMFMNTQFMYTLNLTHNKINVIPDNTFTFLNNLTALDLSHNPIVATNLRGILSHTPRLQLLNIRGMGLYSMPAMSAMPYLSELDAGENNLQEIAHMQMLSHLRAVRLAHNKITNLTAIGFRLPHTVRLLDVSRNPIRKTLLHDLLPIRWLEELRMYDVRMSHPMFLAKLQNLRVLHANAQTNFGDIVSRVTAIQQLYIEVTEPIVDGTLLAKLRNHTKLNVVEISGPKVMAITQNAFVGLANNQRLVLRVTNTQINDFPPAIFFALKNIPHLSIDLSMNRMISLAPDSFYPNASSWDAVGTRSVIGGLDLYGNPLHCDCGLVWLGHWLRRWLRETAQINAISKDEMKMMLMVS